jgi:hypothetical protein
MSDKTTSTTLPVLRAIPTFFASDQTSFSSRKDATVHQLGLEIRSLLIDEGFQDNGDLKKIALTLAKKQSKFKNTWDKLGRAHRMVVA